MSDEAAEPSPETTDPAARIAQLEEQLGQASDAYLRARADYQNLKRRTDEEREGLKAYLVADVLTRILPVVDNFERALAAAEATRDFEKLVGGIEGIRRQLADLLEKEGVEAIDAVGQPFDPNLHNAILRDESSDAPENTVIEELQRGYTLGGRVLRAALVKVSAG